MNMLIKRLQSASMFKADCELEAFSQPTYDPVSCDAPATVIMSTGPGIVTSTYYKYQPVMNVSVQPHRCFEYCSKAERHEKLSNNDMSLPDDAFGIHWMMGSWISSDMIKPTTDVELKYKFRDK